MKGFAWPRASPILSQAAHVLEECDFGGRTLLMHAARSGSAPVFRVVLHALRSAVDKGGGAPVSGAPMRAIPTSCEGSSSSSSSRTRPLAPGTDRLIGRASTVSRAGTRRPPVGSLHEGCGRQEYRHQHHQRNYVPLEPSRAARLSATNGRSVTVSRLTLNPISKYSAGAFAPSLAEMAVGSVSTKHDDSSLHAHRARVVAFCTAGFPSARTHMPVQH